MNILFLITRRQTRGAETFAVQLGEELARRGHRLWIASLYAAPETPLAIPPGLEQADLSQSGPRALPRPEILRGIADLIKREEIDVVQANASDNLKYAVLSRWIYGWKSPIVYRNASIMSAWIRGGWHRKLYAKLLDSADTIASVSWKSRTDIITNFGIAERKVHRLGIAAHLHADTDYASARKRLATALGAPLEPDVRLIFHVGAFTPEKNHPGLLRIFDRIQAGYTGKVRLVSIGNGPLQRELQEGNTVANVSWLGYRNDVPDLLSAADLLLLPSLIEGTPGVVLEAGAHRVMALAYNVGAVDECYPEELADRAIIPAGREDLMAERAVEYLSNDDLRAADGNRLHDFVTHAYSFSEVGSGFERLFADLAHRLPA